MDGLRQYAAGIVGMVEAEDWEGLSESAMLVSHGAICIALLDDLIADAK